MMYYVGVVERSGQLTLQTTKRQFQVDNMLLFDTDETSLVMILQQQSGFEIYYINNTLGYERVAIADEASTLMSKSHLVGVTNIQSVVILPRVFLYPIMDEHKRPFLLAISREGMLISTIPLSNNDQSNTTITARQYILSARHGNQVYILGLTEGSSIFFQSVEYNRIDKNATIQTVIRYPNIYYQAECNYAINPISSSFYVLCNTFINGEMQLYRDGFERDISRTSTVKIVPKSQINNVFTFAHNFFVVTQSGMFM
jgi:hypothetical protein